MDDSQSTLDFLNRPKVARSFSNTVCLALERIFYWKQFMYGYPLRRTIMLGLDVRVIDIDLIIQRRKCSLIHFKYGSLDSRCIQVNTSDKNCGLLSIIDKKYIENLDILLNSKMEVKLSTDSLEFIGCGSNDNIKLTANHDYNSIVSPTFTFVGSSETVIDLATRKPKEPEIKLGWIKLCITLYELYAVVAPSIQKLCRVEEEIRY